MVFRTGGLSEIIKCSEIDCGDGYITLCNGHEFEQAPGVGDGQGSLMCCSPWGHKESDTTEQLNDNKTV